MNHTALRALVARVQQGISRVASTTPSNDDQKELTAAWDSLVNHLALGEEPNTRPCPHCNRRIMSAATLCGYCWAKLEAEAPHA